jgi:hypothetical protein
VILKKIVRRQQTPEQVLEKCFSILGIIIKTLLNPKRYFSSRGGAI